MYALQHWLLGFQFNSEEFVILVEQCEYLDETELL